MSQGTTTTSAQVTEVYALGVELPVDLARAVESYVAQRPGLDPARLLQTALAQFLVQQGGARPEVRELYLDGLFGTGL
ncbi:DUF2811 domain-containing protein [Synechococcus sp. CBW1107]|jgi:hypothetical protein|uniref:DUF2811 domain-containing protein n=1 Tax=Synechococcus sp. CBW1107 TaxID=2789857 RepID=UPI002AD2BBAC|nr:DUF2811 domain-containing protein [Synechococcus sp. CBW1107]CAK6689591.1 hypothetical protein MNNICLKF_00650 [Synechococcus sp. CBW1107]